MRHDLFMTLYDGDAGIAGDGPNPGASARSRYAVQYRVMMEFAHE